MKEKGGNNNVNQQVISGNHCLPLVLDDDL